jgi:hypothetical protein
MSREINHILTVSEWEEYGKKYGYWDYFKKIENKELVNYLKEQMYDIPSIQKERIIARIINKYV